MGRLKDLHKMVTSIAESFCHDRPHTSVEFISSSKVIDSCWDLEFETRIEISCSVSESDTITITSVGKTVQQVVDNIKMQLEHYCIV